MGTGYCIDLDTAHLGYEHSDRTAKAKVEGDQGNNFRNGAYTKTVDSGYGPLQVVMPTDRAGTFVPRMVPKGARRLTGLDDMIISLYAGGMTVRDIHHRGGYEPRYDQYRHRRRIRRGDGLAKPPTR